MTARQTTGTFDEYYHQARKQANVSCSVPASFLTTIKNEVPVLYDDLFSTSFPLDPRIADNLYELVKHFGMQAVKDYPSLFLAVAYTNRMKGLHHRTLAPCEGL